jgi:hypothetical protein
MNINIYVENKLGQQLKTEAKVKGITRNALIREALHYWFIHHKAHEWPSVILNYRGDPAFPAFESHRKALKKAKDDPFE